MEENVKFTLTHGSYKRWFMFQIIDMNSQVGGPGTAPSASLGHSIPCERLCPERSNPTGRNTAAADFSFSEFLAPKCTEYVVS